MICVQQISATNFALRVVNPQPVNTATCTMVVASPSEIQPSAWNDLLTMDAATGSAITAAILLVWVTGWAIGQGARLGSSNHD